jgi:hypothetical protein
LGFRDFVAEQAADVTGKNILPYGHTSPTTLSRTKLVVIPQFVRKFTPAVLIPLPVRETLAKVIAMAASTFIPIPVSSSPRADTSKVRLSEASSSASSTGLAGLGVIQWRSPTLVAHKQGSHTRRVLPTL